MIDIRFEKLIALVEASKIIPARPCTNTLWRWRKKGIKGRKLESVVIGGKVYTSVEAVLRFCEQHGGDSIETPLRTPSAREKAIKKAEAELAKAGV